MEHCAKRWQTKEGIYQFPVQVSFFRIVSYRCVGYPFVLRGDSGHCGAPSSLDSPGTILYLLVNLSASDRQSQWLGKAPMAARPLSTSFTSTGDKTLFFPAHLQPFLFSRLILSAHIVGAPPFQMTFQGNANTSFYLPLILALCQTAIVVWESGHGGAPPFHLIYINTG